MPEAARIFRILLQSFDGHINQILVIGISKGFQCGARRVIGISWYPHRDNQPAMRLYIDRVGSPGQGV